MRYWKIYLLSLFCFSIVLFKLFGTQEPPLMAAQKNTPTRDIHLFAVEYQSQINGKKQEVYRFDPGTIVVQQGERIRLHLHGFHGKEHSFSLPAWNIHGKIQKGKVTTITFPANKLGTFELICHNHATKDTHGPMVSYITIVKSS